MFSASLKSVGLGLSLVALLLPFDMSWASGGHGDTRPVPSKSTLIPKAPVPATWVEAVCIQYPGEPCLAAQGWTWFRSQDILIEDSANVMAGAGAIWSLALVARWVLGPRPAIQLVITGARAGMQAGAIALGGAVLTATIGTVASAAVYGLWATPTGGYYDDQPKIALKCQGVDLHQYETPAGQRKLITMSPEDLEKILPCIPADNSLYTFLTDGASNGQNTINQTLN